MEVVFLGLDLLKVEDLGFFKIKIVPANKKVVIRMWRPNDESNRNISKVLPVAETKNLPQRPIQDTP